MARTVEDLFKWPVRRDECYYEKQTITIKCYAAVNPSGCQLVSGTRTLAPGHWQQSLWVLLYYHRLFFVTVQNYLSFSGFNALIDQYVLHVDNIVDVIDTNL